METMYRIETLNCLQKATDVPRDSRVVFVLPWLGREQAQSLGRQATTLASACGCGMAAAFVLGVLPLCLAVDLIVWPALHDRAGLVVTADLLAVALGAVAGKALGLARARWKLGRMLKTLARDAVSGRRVP